MLIHVRPTYFLRKIKFNRTRMAIYPLTGLQTILLAGMGFQADFLVLDEEIHSGKRRAESVSCILTILTIFSFERWIGLIC